MLTVRAGPPWIAASHCLPPSLHSCTSLLTSTQCLLTSLPPSGNVLESNKSLGAEKPAAEKPCTPGSAAKGKKTPSAGTGGAGAPMPPPAAEAPPAEAAALAAAAAPPAAEAPEAPAKAASIAAAAPATPVDPATGKASAGGKAASPAAATRATPAEAHSEVPKPEGTMPAECVVLFFLPLAPPPSPTTFPRFSHPLSPTLPTPARLL
jgi:hypothetical protein